MIIDRDPDGYSDIDRESSSSLETNCFTLDYNLAPAVNPNLVSIWLESDSGTAFSSDLGTAPHSNCGHVLYFNYDPTYDSNLHYLIDTVGSNLTAALRMGFNCHKIKN
ncbi:hypothetical protein EVAR_97985_1 [Eumeta japonica]|uniref:Uncharacterized protein n=1 Tax=Eumeta variegata TaxID=151549 RepID=A0A4C2AID3_EUMVA|nr:hypothetical protein EVAR_97985_1 [Eumeta japonica]